MLVVYKLLYSILLWWSYSTVPFDVTVCSFYVCLIQVMFMFMSTVNVCRFWGITSNTQLYHGVLLLANVLLSAFIQLCQVECISKFSRRMT